MAAACGSTGLLEKVADMPKRERIVRHIALDPPIYLHSGDVFKAKHVIQAGSLIGRVLFTEPSPLIHVAAGARDVRILHCVFEGATVGVEVF